MDQWNKMQSPKINPCTYGQLIFYKGVKNIQRGKDDLFNKWHWKSWIAIRKKIKLGPYFIPHTKNQLKMD